MSNSDLDSDIPILNSDHNSNLLFPIYILTTYPIFPIPLMYSIFPSLFYLPLSTSFVLSS